MGSPCSEGAQACHLQREGPHGGTPRHRAHKWRHLELPRDPRHQLKAAEWVSPADNMQSRTAQPSPDLIPDPQNHATRFGDGLWHSTADNWHTVDPPERHSLCYTVVLVDPQAPFCPQLWLPWYNLTMAFHSPFLTPASWDHLLIDSTNPGPAFGGTQTKTWKFCLPYIFFQGVLKACFS